MHNHNLPKEHLATWNRTETTRKAVRGLSISCFGLAFQPRSSIWHMFVKSVSNLDLMQRMAIDYSRRRFPTFTTRFSGDLQRSWTFLIEAASHFKGTRTQFYIGWSEVIAYYMTRQLKWGSNQINQWECLITGTGNQYIVYIRPQLHTSEEPTQRFFISRNLDSCWKQNISFL